MKIKFIIYCHQCGDVIGTASTIPSATQMKRKHELQPGHDVAIYDRIEADDRNIVWLSAIDA